MRNSATATGLARKPDVRSARNDLRQMIDMVRQRANIEFAACLGGQVREGERVVDLEVDTARILSADVEIRRAH